MKDLHFNKISNPSNIIYAGLKKKKISIRNLLLGEAFRCYKYKILIKNRKYATKICGPTYIRTS